MKLDLNLLQNDVEELESTLNSTQGLIKTAQYYIDKYGEEACKILGKIFLYSDKLEYSLNTVLCIRLHANMVHKILTELLDIEYDSWLSDLLNYTVGDNKPKLSSQN